MATCRAAASRAAGSKTLGKGMSGKIKLNTDTDFLKLVAIVSMLIDHLGARVFPQYGEMRLLGRLAFPLFAYCMAMGCVFTRNIGKYALRVGLLAIVVQPLYATAMGHQQMMSFDWANNFYRVDLLFEHYYLAKPSILFSLFLGILLIWSIKEKKYLATGVLLAIVWYIQSYLDYGLNGILLMLLFYAFREKPLTSLVWVASFMIWWGVPAIQTSIPNQFPQYVSTQFYALMALPLIYFPFSTGIRVNKYVFYAFYPAHLALIYLLTM